MGNNLNVPVKIKRLRSQAKLPAYATEGAAAMDLCAVLEAPFTLAPGQRALLPTALPLSCRARSMWRLFLRAPAWAPSTGWRCPTAWA